MRHSVLGILVLAAVLGSLAPGWSPVAHAQARPGVRQPFAPPLFPLELRRQIPLGGGPQASPAVAGRRLFLPLRPGGLVAIDVDAGRVAWQVPLAVVHPPVLAGEHLVVATAETLEALSPNTGESVWRLPLPASVAAPPLVADGTFYLLLANGDVWAVKATEPGALWKVSLGMAAAGAAAAESGALYVALAEGKVVALATRDGRQLWEQRVGEKVTGLRAGSGRLYVGALDNFFYCLDGQNGRVRWRWRTGGDIAGAAVVDEHRVYFSSLDNVLRALDRDSGVQRWKRSLDARPVVGPLLVGPTLLMTGLSPQLQGVRVSSGEAAGRYDLGADPGAGPVFVPGPWVGEDLVAVATAEGNLFLLGRRLSPSISAPAALPGTPVPVTVQPPSP